MNISTDMDIDRDIDIDIYRHVDIGTDTYVYTYTNIHSHMYIYICMYVYVYTHSIDPHTDVALAWVMFEDCELLSFAGSSALIAVRWPETQGLGDSVSLVCHTCGSN